VPKRLWPLVVSPLVLPLYSRSWLAGGSQYQEYRAHEFHLTQIIVEKMY